MLSSTDLYFFEITLRRIFSEGVISPASIVNSLGRMTNFLMVSKLASCWFSSSISLLDESR